MPVAGIDPGLICVGRIKIGVKGEEKKSAGGKDYKQPEKLDHFILITNEVDKDERAVIDEELLKIVKANPLAEKNKDGNLVSIPIRLLYDDPNVNFPHQRTSVDGGKFACTGDGIKGKTRDGREVKCPCEKAVETGYSEKDKCKLTGTLSCVIDGVDSLGGCHKLYTTGNSVKFILGSMLTISTVTGGMLRGLPLSLIIQPRKTSAPGAGFVTVFNVGIVSPSTDKLQEIALNLAQGRATYFQKMEKIEEEARRITYTPSEEEEKVIADEFFVDSEAPPPGDKDVPPSGGEDVKDTPQTSEKDTGETVEDSTDTAKEASDKEQTSPETIDSDKPTPLPDPKTIDGAKLPKENQVELTAITLLKKELGINEIKAWKKLLEAFGVVSAKQMTIEQLRTFRRKLEEMRPT